MGVIDETRDQIIREYNHVIAIFTGYKYDSKARVNRVPGVYTKRHMMSMRIDDFKYNSSWNAIMPVCKKFDRLYQDKSFLDHNRYEEMCDALDNAVTTYDINNVYPQLVKNIQWYNSYQK